MKLTPKERADVAHILSRRANEIAHHSGKNHDEQPSSVEMALTREIQRLRRLADKINPPKPDPDNE